MYVHFVSRISSSLQLGIKIYTFAVHFLLNKMFKDTSRSHMKCEVRYLLLNFFFLLEPAGLRLGGGVSSICSSSSESKSDKLDSSIERCLYFPALPAPLLLPFFLLEPGDPRVSIKTF